MATALGDEPWVVNKEGKHPCFTDQPGMIFDQPDQTLPMKLNATLLLSLFGFTANAQFNLATDLRAFYPLNGDWWNAQGGSDDHALFANATFGNDAQAVASNAGLFSGSTRVNINRGVIGAQTGTFTVEFWFRSAATTSQVLYWEGALNQQSVWIRLEPANSRIQASLGTSTQFLQAPAAGTFNNGVWHHYALTAANNTIATVYVDGVLNATYTGAWPTTATTNFTRLGCKEDLTQYLNGSLDDVRVWGRALTAAEVAASFNAPTVLIAAVGSTTLCAGDNATIVYSVVGGSGAFPAGNAFTAQLSGPDGSFEYPRVIGAQPGTGSGSITITLPTDITTSANYRVRLLASGIPVASQGTVALTITNANSFPGYDIHSGLRIHYPFDGDAVDATGNGFSGTPTGTASAVGHTGDANGALFFSGSNARVAIGDRWPIKKTGGTTQPVTISLWLLQTVTPSDFGYVFSLYNGNTSDGLFLGTTNTGQLRFRVNGNQLLQVPFANGVWTLVTAVYTGTQIRLYQNGVQVATTNTTGTLQNQLAAAMGWESITSQYEYYGHMDDFRFYDRALTVEEVRMLYREGSLASSNSPLCSSVTLQLQGPTYAGLTYDWSGPAGFTSDIEDPTITPFNSFTNVGTYALQLTLNGCTAAATTTTVIAAVAAPDVTSAVACEGTPYTLTASGAGPGLQYDWYADAQGQVLLAANTDSYSGTATTTDTLYVILTDGAGCNSVPALAVVVVTAIPVVDLGPDVAICAGEQLVLDATLAGATYLWQNGSTLPTFSVLASGTYSVEVSRNGCSGSDAITIAVNPLPVVDYNEVNSIVCASDVIFQLTPGTPLGGTYNGPGVSGELMDPVAAGVGTHSIQYSYTDANGCTNTDVSVINVEVCTQVAQVAGSTISVSPNPFTDQFTLSGSTVGAWIRVCDMTGREMAHERTTSGRASFDSSAWPSGVYCVQQSGEHPLTFRLVKQ